MLSTKANGEEWRITPVQVESAELCYFELRLMKSGRFNLCLVAPLLRLCDVNQISF